MAKCKGSKCKSAADCDDCVVKAARKASAKKTKERNAMLLLKAKILEKMPKAAPVDPFASYRNLPRKQKFYPPTPQTLTLQNVADEIERAFARRDKPSSTLEKREAPAARAAREVPEAELESTTWLLPLAAERKAPTRSFGTQASSPIEPYLRPTVGGFFPEEREAPSLEESVMELTDVAEFDDEDAMEALDAELAPGAAALSASTEEAAADEVRIASDEPFVMDPIWEATLSGRVPSLDLSSVSEAPDTSPKYRSPLTVRLRKTATGYVPSNLYSDPLFEGIAESGEEVMGTPAESLADAIAASENRAEALKPVRARSGAPSGVAALSETGAEGVGMNVAMDAPAPLPSIKPSAAEKAAIAKEKRRARDAGKSEDEIILEKKERKAMRDSKKASAAYAAEIGEAADEGAAYRQSLEKAVEPIGPSFTFAEEPAATFDVEF